MVALGSAKVGGVYIFYTQLILSDFTRLYVSNL